MLHCHHHNDFRIKMGSVSHFNVSLIVHKPQFQLYTCTYTFYFINKNLKSMGGNSTSDNVTSNMGLLPLVVEHWSGVFVVQPGVVSVGTWQHVCQCHVIQCNDKTNKKTLTNNLVFKIGIKSPGHFYFYQFSRKSSF